MRAVFIGSVESSHCALQTLLEFPAFDIVGIVTRSKSAVNADFFSLEGDARSISCPVFNTDQQEFEQLAEWVAEKRPDVIFCIGWSYLLPKSVIEIPNQGVIGYHPAALPLHRGRHPLIWSLVLGLEQMGSTLFFIDEGADSGDIINQKFVDIADSDNAGTLYGKMLVSLADQLRELLPGLLNGQLQRIPQCSDKATYWRKRNRTDGQIDWRMPAKGIHNLVRALTKPYPGAHCTYQAKEYRIWETRIVPNRNDDVEPGKVLSADTSGITIKCGVDAIELVYHELKCLPEAGDYL